MIENGQHEIARLAAQVCDLKAEIANLREENRELLGRCECYRVEVYTLTRKLERFESLAGKELI